MSILNRFHPGQWFFGSSIILLAGVTALPLRAAAPGPVGDTVRLSQPQGAGGPTQVNWDSIPDATYYNTYLGPITGSGMGSRGAQGYQILSASGPGGQFAQCPSGKRVIGGGADGSAHLWGSRPEPPGTGWYASAGGPFVVAYAICAEVDPSYEIVSLSGGGGQFVPCPAGKKVIGGGADGTSPLVSSRPEPPGTGWYGSAGGPFVISYAICANVDASYEVLSASGGGGQYIGCSGQKTVVGGGAESTSLMYNSRPEPPGIGWYANAAGPFIVDYAICLAGPYGHSCLEAGDAQGNGATLATIGATPSPGSGFYVLVSGGNSSGEGPLGDGRDRDGSPTPRPNPSACATPP